MVLSVGASIVVPLHNEEGNIHDLLCSFKRILEPCLQSYEIILVDDGSTDNTLGIIKEQEKSDGHIRVVSCKKNMGKGYAIKIGIMQSRYPTVVFVDGDLDISPTAIKDYIKVLQKDEILIGSKRHPASKVNMSMSRRFLSRSFNLIVRLMIGIRLKDTQVGLKAGNRCTLMRIFQVICVQRYAFDVELLTIANILNLNIRELSIDANITKGFKIYEAARMFEDVIGIWYRYRIKKYYQRMLGVKV